MSLGISDFKEAAQYLEDVPRQKFIPADYRDGIKTEIINVYSGGANCCECCGESHLDLLTIDHIHGRLPIEKNKKMYGIKYYLKLKREGFPDKDRMRVLCFNCNFGERMNGGCPHKRV